MTINMTNNITKIEEILKNLVVVIKLGEIKAVPPSEVENVRESVVKELQALIEKREREAVEGFATWLGKKQDKESGFFDNCCVDEYMSETEEYFEGGESDGVGKVPEGWKKSREKIFKPDPVEAGLEITRRFEERIGPLDKVPTPDRGGTPKERLEKEHEGVPYEHMHLDDEIWIQFNYHTSEILSILDELKVDDVDASFMSPDEPMVNEFYEGIEFAIQELNTKLKEIRERYKNGGSGVVAKSNKLRLTFPIPEWAAEKYDTLIIEAEGGEKLDEVKFTPRWTDLKNGEYSRNIGGKE